MLDAITDSVKTFILSGKDNFVQAEDAVREELTGLQIFAEPLFTIGDAADPLFARLKEPDVIHPDVMLPADWLPGARRVLAFFLPFTKAVKCSNGNDMRHPSDEWLHGRIEGQIAVNSVCRLICQVLTGAGYAAVAPSIDERFTMLAPFASNWSERHAAYICGLGTFSLSKGLITEKGIAGRIGSVITDCDLPVTRRQYQWLFEYCTFCRKCEENCPVKAIDSSRGMSLAKDHVTCKKLLDATQSLPPRGLSQRVRYGCGKCQVKTPCQNGIPKRL